jgi:hypothetical protein
MCPLAGTYLLFYYCFRMEIIPYEEEAIIMLSAKYAATFAVLLAILAGSALAQWSPGGMIAYVGDFNLLASSASSGGAVQALGGSSGAQAAVDSAMNNSTVNATLMNSTTIGNSTIAVSAAAEPAQAPDASSGKEVLDLSSYSTDRVNRNLAGYKNIMYPISGSRGTTTSTSGGGGGCGGCS